MTESTDSFHTGGEMYDIPEAYIQLEPNTLVPMAEDMADTAATLAVPEETASEVLVDDTGSQDLLLLVEDEPQSDDEISLSDFALDPGVVMSTEGGNVGGTVYIDGKNITYGGGSGGSGGSGSPFFQTNSMTYNQQEFLPDDPNASAPVDEPDDHDPPHVAAIVDDPAKTPQVQAAAQKLVDLIPALTKLIYDLADGKMIKMADGTFMSGAELKQLWNTIDFVVTDRTFATGTAGAYDRNTGIAMINASYVNLQDSVPNGVAFVMLHELMHHSPRGQAITDQMWQAHMALYPQPQYTESQQRASYNTDSDHFEENEEFTNVGAREIQSALNIPIAGYWDPGSGYEFGNPG